MADINAKLPTINDGIYDLADNPVPSSMSLTTSERNATIDETTLNKRLTSVNGNEDKIALDVAISDSNGNRIDENNPLATYLAESPAEEVDDFNEAVDVVKDATADHDYTVTALKTFKSLEVFGSASGYAKFELQVEDGVGAGTFTTVAVGFNSVARPDVVLKYKKAIAAGIIIKLVKTNLDNQAQSLYSQIKGLEI